MGFLRMSDVEAEVPNLDRPDVLELAEQNRALKSALMQYRPPNWWGSGLRPESIIPVASTSAVPVVWLPRVEVVRELAAAKESDRDDMLITFEAEIVADCRQLLGECQHEWLSNDRALVSSAVDAFSDGHHEAAMALAVAVGEPLALWASRRRVLAFESREEMEDYDQLVRRSSTRTKAERSAALARLKRLGVDLDKYKSRYALAAIELAGSGPGSTFPPSDWRRALISPIPHFFKGFDPDSEEPLPNLASRHATVHRPRVEHLSRGNALRCLMLAASILREQEEWALEVELADYMMEA